MINSPDYAIFFRSVLNESYLQRRHMTTNGVHHSLMIDLGSALENNRDSWNIALWFVHVLINGQY